MKLINFSSDLFHPHFPPLQLMATPNLELSVMCLFSHTPTQSIRETYWLYLQSVSNIGRVPHCLQLPPAFLTCVTSITSSPCFLSYPLCSFSTPASSLKTTVACYFFHSKQTSDSLQCGQFRIHYQLDLGLILNFLIHTPFAHSVPET